VVREEGAAMMEERNEGDRTIFQPSPLQEMRERQAASAAGPSGGAFSALPRPAPAPRDDDIPAPAATGRGRNPMMAAAAPLLALIAAVRSGRARIALPELHQRATRAASRFDEALVADGYDAETRRRARYAVYATVDDIAQNLPGAAIDGAEWARRSLVVRGFGENIGGDRFWLLLTEMLARPAEHAELIELYHACLAAGFEGRHRVSHDGRNRLREIMTGAYAALPHVRALSDTEISPAWRGSPTPVGRMGLWAPLVLALAIAAGVLLVIVLGLRLVLIETGRPSMHALATINPDQPLRLSRQATPPTLPISPQQSRLSGFLAAEIAQKLVVVEQDPTSLRVRTTVGQLFKSGSDALEPGRRPLFERIAAAVQREQGPVRVEGHADGDPVSSLTFPDNVALSKARAETVAAILRAGLHDPTRVSAEGFGSSRPIASNATAEGKALNRRVEVVIPRAE
jgi:type VI secretion system protein ImpK